MENPVFNKYVEHGSLWKRDDGLSVLLHDGSFNRKSFDDGGDSWLPQIIDWAGVDQLAPDVYRIRSGRWGFTVNLGIQPRVLAEGVIPGGGLWVHPVRWYWGLFYEVAPRNAVALSVRKYGPNSIEIYYQAAHVRYNYILSDLGYKINNRIEPSYPYDSFSHKYNVRFSHADLDRSGRWVTFRGKRIARLPDAFMVDADGNTHAVQENITAGELTLSASGLLALPKPIMVDPSIVQQVSSVQMQQSAPTTTGTGEEFRHVFLNGFEGHQPIIDDFSATPMDSIVSATLEWYWSRNPAGNPVGKPVDYFKMIRADSVLNENTWLEFKTGSNWTVAGGTGLGTDIDNSFSARYTYVGSPGKWIPWDITAHSQDALANEASINRLMNDYATAGANVQAGLHSPFYLADPSLRTRITYVFVEPISGNIPAHEFGIGI